MVEHYSHKIQNVIQKELFKAQKSIKIAVAWFTNDLLFQPLLLKLQTGVSVELILNKDDINNSTENEIDFNAFVEAGGALHWNRTKTLMHEKFCIIDDSVVIYGSYNWTNKAEYNDESIAVSKEDGSQAFYSKLFDKLCKAYPLEDFVKPPHINRYIPFDIKNGEIVFDSQDVLVYRWIINEKYVYRIFSKDTNRQICLYDFEDIFVHSCTDVSVIGVKKESKWNFYSLLEKTLKETSYSQIGEINNNNHFWIKKEKWGIADKDGCEILNCKFDGITVYDSFALTKVNGLYGIALKEKGKYWQWQESAYSEVKFIDNNRFLVSADNKWAVLDSESEWGVIIDLEFDEIKPIQDDFFVVRKGQFWGVAVPNFIMKIDCIYDEIKYIGGKRFIVTKNNKKGLFSNNQLLINCEYEELNLDGLTASIKKGKAGVISDTGKIIVNFKYSEVRHYEYRDFPYNKSFFLFYDKPYFGISIDGKELGRIHEKDFNIQSFIPEFSLFTYHEDSLLNELRHAIVRTIYEQIVKPNKIYEAKVQKLSVRVGCSRLNSSIEEPSRTELVEKTTRVVHIAKDNTFLNSKYLRRKFIYTEIHRYRQSVYEYAIDEIKTTQLDHSQIIYENGDIIHIQKNSPVISDICGRFERRYIITKVYRPSDKTSYYTTFNPWDLKREIRGVYKEEGSHRETMYPDGTAVDLCKSTDSVDEIFNILTKNRTRDCKICISNTRIALCRNLEIHGYRDAYIYTYDLC